MVREALEEIGDGRSFFDEPELARLEGELLLKTDPGRAGADAEEPFRRAIDRARELDARSSELRAATRLARLWGEERSDGARALLEPLVAVFESGRDTPDYAEAAALLGTTG